MLYRIFSFYFFLSDLARVEDFFLQKPVKIQVLAIRLESVYMFLDLFFEDIFFEDIFLEDIFFEDIFLEDIFLVYLLDSRG